MNANDADLVLNVNDDEATRYFTTKILKKAGFEVIEGATGTQALEMASASRPSLVLLDVKLPDMSGLEVCRRLKSDPSTSAILVVQTSATFPSSERRVAGLDSGADAYLPQPFEPAELVAILRAALRTRRAEVAEQRAGRKLQRTFAAIVDPMLYVDPNGRVDLANEAASKLLKGGPGALVGRQAAEVLAGLLGSDAVASLLHPGASKRVEAESVIGERSYRVSADPIVDDAGALEGSVLIIQDTSERRRLDREQRARAEDLVVAGRRKDEFLAMLAHELRNPLNAISVANALLEQKVSGERAGMSLCATIHRQTRNLARMVDDLLEVSRITRGLLQLRTKSIDLVAVIRNAIQGASAEFQRRQQTLHEDLPSSPVLVQGDDLRLEQVVANLLVNASKYSEPGSSISIGLRRDQGPSGPIALLEVKDQGVGIAADMLAAVFEPFVQVDQSLSRTLGGLGIGLTMVHNLVRLHGGTATAASEGLNKGSTFTVRLPLEGSEQGVAREVRSTEPGASMEPMRILVVEDNPDTRELVEMWLKAKGHQVTTAADGKTGLELASKLTPQLALVDIGLPGLDGYELAKALRASGEHSTVLIAVSGYGRPEDKARALDAGFDAYVVKPVTDKAIENALRQAHRRPRGAPEAPPPSSDGVAAAG